MIRGGSEMEWQLVFAGCEMSRWRSWNPINSLRSSTTDLWGSGEQWMSSGSGQQPTLLRPLALAFSGYHVQSSCTKTSDTVCAPCEDSMYTELWNWVPECLSCSSRCSPGE